MHQEKDKQNHFHFSRTSKIQQSIKPCGVSGVSGVFGGASMSREPSRDQLGKSKSIDKSRKGISRVNNISKPQGISISNGASSTNLMQSRSQQLVHIPLTLITTTSTINTNYTPLPAPIMAPIITHSHSAITVSPTRQPLGDVNIIHNHNPFTSGGATHNFLEDAPHFQSNNNDINKGGYLNNTGTGTGIGTANNSQYNFHPITNINSNQTPNLLEIPHSHAYIHAQPSSRSPLKHPQTIRQQIIQSKGKKQSEYNYRIQQMAKQIHELQRENNVLLQQKKQWKNKCTELYQLNQQLRCKISTVNIRIEDYQSELQHKEKITIDREKYIFQRQKYIQQLIQFNKQQKQKLSNSYQKITELNTQIQNLTNKIIQLQKQSTITFHQPLNPDPHPSHPSIQQLHTLSTTLAQKSQQLFELKQQNRQLLIRNSTLITEREQLETKNNLFGYQLQKQQEKFGLIGEEFEKLQAECVGLQEEVYVARGVVRELEELKRWKMDNIDAISQHKDCQLIIKQLQQRRLTQIQFHHKQLTRHLQLQRQKQSLTLQKLQHQLQQKTSSLQTLKKFKQDTQLNKQQVIKSVQQMKREYERLIEELRIEVGGLKDRNKGLEGVVRGQGWGHGRGRGQEFQGRVKELEGRVEELLGELAGLMVTVKELQTDNSFLINKLDQQKNRIQQLQRIIAQKQQLHQASLSLHKNAAQLPSPSPMLQNLQIQISTLRQKNTQINTKIVEYESSFNRFSQKIKNLNLQAEKYQKRQEGYLQKIKGLQRQVQEFGRDKQKYMLDIDGLKKQIQDKEGQLSKKDRLLKQKIQQLSQINLTLNSLQTQHNNLQSHHSNLQSQLQNSTQNFSSSSTKLQQLNLKLQQTQIELTKVNTELQCLRKENEECKVKYVYEVNKEKTEKNQLVQKVRVLEGEVGKFKECVGLLKEEAGIYKEKVKVHDTIVKTEINQQKEVRLQLYKQIFNLLASQSVSLSQSRAQSISAYQSQLQCLQILTHRLKIMLQNQQRRLAEVNQSQKNKSILAQKYQEKNLQLEKLLIKMQETHMEKIALVKKDYDVVYSKYLKYRNMVLAYNRDREVLDKARELSKEKKTWK